MICLECQSVNVKKCSMVYESGTVFSGRPGNADRRIVSQTEFARKNEPPREPVYSVWFILLSMVGTIYLCFYLYEETNSLSIALLSFFIVGIFLAFFRLIFLGKKEKEKFRKQKEKWESSWVCLDCGAFNSKI